MKRCASALLLFCLVMLAGPVASAQMSSFIKMTNGYFYDSASGKPWVPHGVAYQTWNRPLGVWQTTNQLCYDLDEMVKMGANSIRIDMVWQHIEERGDNIWNWTNYDYILTACSQRNIRVFALIGYQWPPSWFPDDWYTMHPPAMDAEGIAHTNRWPSDIINYEHPSARAQYVQFMSNVCARYKNHPAVVGWIVGNEYGYLGLWSGILDGYDPYCEGAFRTWCSNRYVSITNANAAWGTSFTNFNQIVFPAEYRAYGTEGAIWADAVQWREDSIAVFTAIGARGARRGDTNHMLSYSTVGMQWGEEDWRYHAEDRTKITAVCSASNASLGFFSVNNYPWSMLGSESQNGHWGVSFTKKVAGVPVVYSETGFTSSEWLWPGMNEFRQGPLIRNSLWEGLEAGAAGVHIFSWMDRPWITDREKGFGLVYADRRIKPAFWTCRDTYSLMEQVKLNDLLMGSRDAKPDIAFLWTAASDSQYNRFECEMQQMAGGLERLGYEPNFINLAELGSGAYTNYKVIILPRNMRVDTNVPGTTKGVLEFLRTVVVTAGVHVLVSADLPGMQNPNGRPMTNFLDQTRLLFGIDASDIGGHEGAQNVGSYIGDFFKPITVTFGTSAVGAVAGGYTYTPRPWKYSDEITVTNGGVLWAEMDSGRNKGFEDATNLVGWGSWTDTNYAPAGVQIPPNWYWAFRGSNMLQVWGDAGIWQDDGAQPFGRYTASAYLRNNSEDPLTNNSYASVGIEWYARNGNYLGVSESPHLRTNTYGPDSLFQSPNMLVNPGFETNGAGWYLNYSSPTGSGFAAFAAETGNYGFYASNILYQIYTVNQRIQPGVWGTNLGKTLRYSVRARADGPVTGIVRMTLLHFGTNTMSTNLDLTSLLTTNWQTYVLYYTPTTSADRELHIEMGSYSGGTNGTVVMFDNASVAFTNTWTGWGNTWVKHSVDDVAPSNAFTYRRVVRIGPENLLTNGALTGTGTAPDGWQNWNDGNHDPDTTVRLGTAGNSWTFWYDGGIYQDITSGFSAGNKLKFGGWLYTPSPDRLRNGTKCGAIQLECYSNGTLMTTFTTGTVNQASAADWWHRIEGVATVPAGCDKVRLVVRSNDGASGDGTFRADDVWVRNASRGGGSVFIDNFQENPAVVVKDHGTAKSAIFLYAVGDMSPDGDMDDDPDTLPWKWRYDVLGSVIKDYFGVQPAISASGTNAFLCLPEYRTLTNGAILMQVKNYMYDIDYPASWQTNGGGAPLTFTISSSLLTGKTIRAWEQGRLIEENCDGTFSVTLAPDGQEMLHAYVDAATADGYTKGSSDGRIARMRNTRTGVGVSGPGPFPLTNVWSTYLYGAGGPVVAHDRVYVTANQYLYCLNVVSGNVLWSYCTTNDGGGSFNPNSIAVADRRVFASTKNLAGTNYPRGAVFAVDAYSGQLLWKVADTNSSYTVSPPVVDGGVVYLHLRSGAFRALDADSGQTLWETRVGWGTDYHGPALANGVLYEPGKLTALAASNGQILWEQSLTYGYSTPAVESNKVYLQVDVTDRGLQCFSATNGAYLWGSSNYVTDQQSPAVGNGRVYFSGSPTSDTYSYYLYCFPANGSTSPLWQFQLGSWYRGSPVLCSNVVYIADGSIYAINASNGALIWSNEASGSYNADPFVKDGWLFYYGGGYVQAWSDGRAWVPAPVTTNQFVQIKDAPAVVHPLGDKAYQVKVQYDCVSRSDLKVKVGFVENGDNGDGKTNEVYESQEAEALGADEQLFWIWIPDWNQKDSDYKSTPDGGKYQFMAWLVDESSNVVASSVPFPTSLKWGVRPTNSVPNVITNGQVVTMPIEWEDLYEYLWWENTPLSRNNAYPGRVAVFRSSKTQKYYTNHYAKVNEVCTWLQSLGYTNGNDLELYFDNVKFNGSFTDDFEDKNYNGWAPAAGCVNWLMAGAPTNAMTNCVACWTCNDTNWLAGTNSVRDSSGKGNHGWPYNGVLTQTNNAVLVRAGWFDGTNDYVLVTNTATLQVNTNLTLCFWMRGNSLGGQRVNPIDKSYGGEFALTIETNRSLSYYHGTVPSNGSYFAWANALPLGSLTNGAWQHVAITRDAKLRVVRSYLNGVLVGVTNYPSTTNMLPAKTTNSVRIGLGYTGYGYGGFLDEVKIFTNAFTAAQVFDQFTMGRAGTNSLRAWRLGNSDNILLYTNAVFTNGTLSVDVRYGKQDYYFNDAEVLFRYQNRDNFYKVGIRNYYGFWRLKYTVRASTNQVQQGWLCDFPKTNRPEENVWYNLKIESYGSTNRVYFNNQLAGTFWATNFASGRIGVGGSALQLGIWEPQKGYFFVDDDEYTFWQPEGESQNEGRALNLDWGYLKGFYPTLILPSVYVMSDVEASNISVWVTNGLNSLIATDGGVAMKNEGGTNDLGRIESVFGVAPVVTNLNTVTVVRVSTNDHYITLDHPIGTTITAAASAQCWPLTTEALPLGTITNNGGRPALLINKFQINTNAPAKVFCFNFGVDAAGQLTNSARFRNIAKRAFEYTRGEPYRIRLELKYTVNPTNPNIDLVLLSTNAWLLSENGWGLSNLVLNIPADGLMTGTNLYWVAYSYAWGTTNAWQSHMGFYSSANETNYVTLDGVGMQILGITPYAYGGRDWDLWVAYNTQTQTLDMVYGLKEKGTNSWEDNWSDGDYAGWTVTANTNIVWSASNGTLRASVVSTGGYAYITRDALNVTNLNITMECSMYFGGGARQGGLTYRGRVLYVNPELCGWADNVPNYWTNGTGVTSDQWLHVVLNVRDGSPYLNSDLYVDGKPVFVSEPIEVTNWTSTSVGFLSPYSSGYVAWDDFRLADEQYSFAVTTQIYGAYVPTSTNPTFWAPAPDYDPDWWEYDGTAYGGKYQWFCYLRGSGRHSYYDVGLYFAPRLMVEAASFPKTLAAGCTTNVPLDWENLDQLPVKLGIYLTDAKTGTRYFESNYTISAANGSGAYPVTIPYSVPSGSNYGWTAYIYPTSAVYDLYPTGIVFGIEGERLGRDDTWRYRNWVFGIEPEMTVTVSNTGGYYIAYHDPGIPLGASAFVWGQTTHNGDYVTGGVPEGVKCWQATFPWMGGYGYNGWGVFYPSNYVDLSRFSYLKFWVKTWESLKVEVEAPRGTKGTVCLTNGVWDCTQAGTWQEITIPISRFITNSEALKSVYGSYMGTLEVPIRYAMSFPTPSIGWVVGSAPYGQGNIRKTTNGGVAWNVQLPGSTMNSLTLYDVDFISTNAGWAVSDTNVIKTVNGGASWTKYGFGVPTNVALMKSLDFVNSSTGWACGYYGRILKTVDGGATWTVQNSGTNGWLYKIRFLDGNTGWCCGEDRCMLKTTDGGANWVKQTVPTNIYFPEDGFDLWDVQFLNASTGWAVGDQGFVMKTVNGGTTWTRVEISVGTAYLKSVHFSDANNGWIAGQGWYFAEISKTTNAGVEWINWLQYCKHANDIYFMNQDTGLVVGYCGAIYRTTNAHPSQPMWDDMFPQTREFYIDNVRWTLSP